jgi:hypothetical protein
MDARQISGSTDAIIATGHLNVDVSPGQLALREALQIAEPLHGNSAQQPYVENVPEDKGKTTSRVACDNFGNEGCRSAPYAYSSFEGGSALRFLGRKIQDGVRHPAL